MFADSTVEYDGRVIHVHMLAHQETDVVMSNPHADPISSEN